MNSPLPAALRAGTPAIRVASYVLAALALGLVLMLHLVSALLAGLLVFELVQSMAPLLGRRIPGDRARMVVVTALGIVVVGLLMALILGAVGFFRSELGNPELVWQQQLMPLVERARAQLPAALVNHLPDSVDESKIEARIDKGVLRITAAKRSGATSPERKIEVKKS